MPATVRMHLAALTLAIAAVGVVAGCGGASGTAAPQAASPTPATKASSLPPSPVQDRLATCMNDAGWSAERSWLGGVDYAEIPSDRQPAFDQDFARCSESSRWSDAVDLDRDQVRELYQQEVAAHDCYEQHGLSSFDPPELDEYVASYATEQQYLSFLPGFDRLREDDMIAAIKACPPPSWFLDLSSLK